MDTVSPNTVDPVFFGFSAAWLAVGDSDADENAETWVVVGAPGPDGSGLESDGLVYLYPLDEAEGILDAASVQQLARPTGGPWQGFGRALLAADVMECQQITYPGPPPTTAWVGCGQELLVSAASSGGAPGGVFVYARDTSLGGNALLKHFQTIQEPTTTGGPSAFDNFGSSLAAPRTMLDPDVPSVVAPDHPTWVAVLSGPDAALDSCVWLFEVDPSSTTTPLSRPSWDQWCNASGTPPITSITAGDWNSDGLPDYAYGRPDGSTSSGTAPGEVRLFLGANDSSDPSWHPNPYDFLPTFYDYTMSDWSGWGKADGFGTSLASGSYHVDTDWETNPEGHEHREALLIGAPGYRGSGSAPYGAVCEMRIIDGETNFNPTPEVYSDCTTDLTDSSSFLASHTHHWIGGCIENPYATAGDEFGASVAVGNFIAEDGYGYDGSIRARQHEIAVGAPGYGGEGRVYVFQTDIYGLVGDVDCDGTVEAALEIDPMLSVPGQRFGATLAAGTGQREVGFHYSLHGREDHWHDLLVGAPFRDLNLPPPAGSHSYVGGLELTEALSVAACVEPHGYWGHGTPADHPIIRVATTANHSFLRVTFLEDFPLEIRDSSGDLCTVDDEALREETDTGAVLTEVLLGEIPEGASLDIPAPYSCGHGSTGSRWVDPTDAIGLMVYRRTGEEEITLGGQSLTVEVYHQDGGTPALLADDQLELRILIPDVDKELMGMDESCEVEAIPIFTRADLVCEDAP